MVGRLETVSRIGEHFVVGSGEIGRKSRGLLADRDIIRKAGFVFPEFGSITPAFFRSFLEESGALGKNQLEPERCIMQHEFNKAEREQIAAAALSFEPSATGWSESSMRARAIMVRSDEWAGGSGIWKSCVASSPLGKENLFLERVFEALKTVLASDFTQAAKEFRQKLGIEGNAGAMLMPVYGENVEVKGQHYIMPPTGLVCMSKNGNNVFAAIGNGMRWMERSLGGGYFGGPEKDELGATGSRLTFEYTHMRGALDVVQSKIITSMREGVVECPERGRYAGLRARGVILGVGEIARQNGARYYEIIRDGWMKNDWVVVQAATPKIPEVACPKVEEEQIVYKTDKVVGSAIANTRGVLRMSTKTPDSVEIGILHVEMKAYEYDGRNNGYLVLVERMVTGDDEYIESILEQLENKAAIVFCVDQIQNALASHLNGRLRELGVPVLAVEGGFNTISSFGENAEFMVYADEWAEGGPAGFIARK